MPSKCFVCKGNTLGNIRFPSDDTRRSVWLNNLHIKEVPNSTSRICVSHFKASDFIEGKKKNVLKDSAIPSLLSTPSSTHFTESSVMREHSYSSSSTEREKLITDLIQLIFSVGVLFLTLLSILFFIFERGDYEYFFGEKENQDKFRIKKNKKPRGKFMPAVLGSIQIMYVQNHKSFYKFCKASTNGIVLKNVN